MTRVGHQAVSVEIRREEPFAKRNRFLSAHAVDACGAPNVLGHLDDERAGLVVELVGVRLEPAPFGLLERKGKRVEELMGAEPDVTALAALDFRLNHVLVLRPDRAA